MSAGRPRRDLADLQAAHRAEQPRLDNLPAQGAMLPPTRSLRDAAAQRPARSPR